MHPAQTLGTNSIYCETQCNNVTSGPHSGVRALALAQSLANDDAATLRPAYCGKHNQCFLRFHKNKKMPSRRHHNATGERMSVAKSARRALLCAVADHLCYLVASGLLRSSCFSANFAFTRYGLRHIGASCPMQTVVQNIHVWYYQNARYLCPAHQIGRY